MKEMIKDISAIKKSFFYYDMLYIFQEIEILKTKEKNRGRAKKKISQKNYFISILYLSIKQLR